MCNGIGITHHRHFEAAQQSKTDNPRLVTIGFYGKTTLFTQRGSDKEYGFIRVNGKTVAGYVPDYGKGGKVFFYSGKNGVYARQAA